ncbi:MAG: thiolase family protein [Deltaproteobacteria bacterium]|nr:thiolase family protein [Deltaproteobacteria bacterium]
MERAFIIGVGQTRFGNYPTMTLSVLAEQALNLALIDAGLTKTDVEALIPTGWEPAPNGVEWELLPSAARGGAEALHLAFKALTEGRFEVIAAVASAKTARQPSPGAPEGAECLTWFGRELASAGVEVGRREISAHQLARIASKNRHHASLNPRACCPQPLTPDEVLADAMIAHPFTRAMCARPSDGAACVLVCSQRFLTRLGRVEPVEIIASISAPASIEGEVHAIREAYGHAGLCPGEIGVAEVHDLTAYGELRQVEALGLCERGDGAALAEAGQTSLGGKTPVNTSGGLEAQGYPAGAAGLAQIHELITQLRARAGQRQAGRPVTGVALSGGPDGGAELTVVHVLKRVTG